MDSKHDVRDDEEQQKKCQEVLELLVAAGYFRARIKGISHFDKVVGGLVWCIEVCNVDIDVELLFQEDLSIGKKISLTEKIVTVINGMECPFAIEPHQIQGLDYIHIFPVVQWLVKKAIEKKQIEGDEVRKFAVGQFHQQRNSEVPQEVNGIETIEGQNETKRIYRQKESKPQPDVDLTLLEYGQRKARSSKASDDLVKDGHMDEVEGQAFAAKAVKDIIDVQSLANAANRYTKELEHINYETNPAALMKAIQIMEEQKEAAMVRLNAVKEESKVAQPSLDLAKERTDKLVADINEIEQEMNDQEVSAEKEELLAKLQRLVTKNELLKQKEAEFKEECRNELETLMQENETLEEELKALKGEKVIEENKEADERLLHKLRTKLAQVSRQVHDLEYQIDAIPSRYELAQYQKRFVELDNQVAAEYCETQKFVIMFNTLRDQLLFMEKEIKLLNSIYDGIPDAKLSSSAAKQQFMSQLQQIHTSVQQYKAKIDQTFKDQQRDHDDANQELNQLMEQQRTYSVLVRDMTEEMRKNEALSSDKS